MSAMLNSKLSSSHELAPWDSAIAQLCIAQFDAGLKESMVKTQHNVDDHNICLARIDFYENVPELILAAYSASSVLGTHRGTYFGFKGCISVDVDAIHLEHACKGMGRHHTEPKLVNAITQDPSIWYHQVGGRTIRNVTIISQIDVCKTCSTHTLSAFKVALEQRAATLTVYSLQKNPSLGQECQYTLEDLKV